ncbi:MAG TPA: hypothetical protein VMU28_14115 [Terriglobales bacterium]|nr:hypothetical protein [Terriglobales bacterium]
MKKLTLLVALAIALGAMAQETTTIIASNSKPPAPTPMAQPAAAPDATALPIGTAIRVKLETPLSTSTTKFGDHFNGRVTEAVVLNGKTIIPVGASLEGQVIRSTSQRRIKGLPSLDLRPTSVTLPDGQKYVVNATIVDTSTPGKLKVSDEGTIKGKGHDRADTVELGVGTALGTGIGAAIDGWKGAGIGAAIGAGITTVHWLIKTRNADIPSGTELIIQLNHPVALNAAQEGD